MFNLNRFDLSAYKPNHVHVAIGLSALLSTYLPVTLADITSLDSFDEKNIHQMCYTSPRQCLDNIDLHLSDVPNQGRIWFQYKMYQLDALFQLGRLSELSSEVEPWLVQEDIPLRFKISVFIYHAKILQGQGESQQANEYLEKAIALLKDVNEASADPAQVVQIANTLNSLKRFQQGYDLLKPLAKKYRNRHMPKFKHELFENLGHFAYRLGKLDEHLTYRLLALEWAKEVGNDNQTAISYYNVARAHQELKNYERGFYYFAIAEKMKALGEYDQNMIFYRRAQMSLAMGEVAQAEKFFNTVNRQVEIESYIAMFNKLEEEIVLAKSKQ